jgi:hypothetical protein
MFVFVNCFSLMVVVQLLDSGQEEDVETQDDNQEAHAEPCMERDADVGSVDRGCLLLVVLSANDKLFNGRGVFLALRDAPTRDVAVR